jgi:hypothetical protein
MAAQAEEAIAYSAGPGPAVLAADSTGRGTEASPVTASIVFQASAEGGGPGSGVAVSVAGMRAEGENELLERVASYGSQDTPQRVEPWVRVDPRQVSHRATACVHLQPPPSRLASRHFILCI